MNYSMTSGGLKLPDNKNRVRDGKTQQRFEAESNIANIMKRYRGKMNKYDPPTELSDPRFGDFTGIEDFHQAMNQIKIAEETFKSIPSEIRREFGNDIGRFIDFIDDPKNIEEAIEMGILKAKPKDKESGGLKSQGNPGASTAGTDGIYEGVPDSPPQKPKKIKKTITETEEEI